MKLLRRAKEILSYAGITAEQSMKKSLVNRKSAIAILVLSLSTASCLLYILHDVNTFTEYTYSIAAFSSLLVATCISTISIWKMEPLFDYISVCENKAVAPSEFDLLYLSI